MKDDRRSASIRINDQEILRVDQGLAFAIYYLNDQGITTLGCCSGHGRYTPTIIIKEENGEIKELLSGISIPRKKRFYIKDKKGFYFIPEVNKVRK